jgi:hypothetical protein
MARDRLTNVQARRFGAYRPLQREALPKSCSRRRHFRHHSHSFASLRSAANIRSDARGVDAHAAPVTPAVTLAFQPDG